MEIQKVWNEKQIRIREEDRYVSLTDIANATNKKVGHWLENKETKEYLAALESVIGIPISELIERKKGGNPQKQGTFAHPKVALRFAQWCSAELAVQVDFWIDELLTTGSVSLKPKTALELAREQVKLLEHIERIEAEKELLEQENYQLSEAVDELFEYSSIIRVAKFNGCDEKAFSWRKLKAASKSIGVEIKQVPCPRFETKNLYSHDAWRYVYPEYRLPETTTLVIKK